jgi:BAAT / Acyl-CoA thioester hydrolase C terminal
MKFRLLLIGFLLIAFGVALCGCGHSVFQGALDRGTKAPAYGREEIPEFAYQKAVDAIDFRIEEETDEYTVYYINIRQTDFPELRKRNARVYYYEQKDKSRKHPALICLPPTGGPIEIVKTFARFYAEQGYNTIAFYRREQFFNPKKTFDYNSLLIRQSVIDVRRGIDFLETREAVDQSQVAVLGMSLGGILGALATVSDGRIGATVMLVSSGNLAEIMATSHYGRVAKFRRGMVKRYNLKNEAELLEFARPLMERVDPVTYADRMDPARLLMINGYQDNIIKISAAQHTWQAFGRPEWRTLPIGHYSAFAMIGLAKKWTLEHFEKVFGPNL